MVAKIADLGVARLIPEVAAVMTKCPGTPYYMPPEAEGGDYNKSLDIFSFGVLCLFTLTQTVPEPLPMKYTEKSMSFSRSEVERRRSYLDQSRAVMSWLVDTIEECLHDVPDKRPTAEEMLSILESGGLEEEHMKIELVQAIETTQKRAVEGEGGGGEEKEENVEKEQENVGGPEDRREKVEVVHAGTQPSSLEAWVSCKCLLAGLKAVMCALCWCV